MRLPIIVGALIAVVVVAAGILAPQLRSGDAKAAEEAREQAALALRLLHRHDYRLPRLERLAEPAALKDANLEEFLERIRERLREPNQKYSRELSSMRSRAATDGLPPPTAQVLTADVSGLRRASDQYERAFKDNADLLAEAAQAAGQARRGKGASVLGVPQISGMAEYTRAAGLLAEAHVLRRQQQVLQTRLLMLGAQWKAYQASQDYLAGLDVREILGQLRDDLEEVRELADEGAKRAADLAAEVARREQEVARIDEDLRKGRNELLALQQQGFTVGDDDSFNAYREKHGALSDRLRVLEEEEQLLRFGGRRGAELVGDDLKTARIEGGQAVVGLEVLKQQRSAAQERATRLTGAVESLNEHIGFVEQAGREAKQGEDRYGELQEEVDAAQKEIVPEQLLRLANEASEKEHAALEAAREAVSAFASSQQAANKFKSNASTLQREKDPERINRRLKMIVADPALPQFADSAKAAALVLLGRIYAQRIVANQSLIDDLNLFVELRPGPQFKTDVFEEELSTARENANQALGEAQEIYQRLAQKAPEEHKWVPQAGLATVYHVLAQVNPAESAGYLADALAAVQEAVTDREHSPYLTEHVQFRNHLREKTGRGGGGAAEADEDGMYDDEDAEDEGG